jgi:chromosome segregation ATPase
MTLDDSYREMCLEVEALRVSLARKVRHCDEITEERDKALADLDEAQARVIDAALIHAELVRERDEARSEVERWRTSYDAASGHAVDVRAMLDQVRKELYEARSEVERLTDERDELLVRVADQDAELRATREAYIDAKWTNAYRRGAEAMREACARVADAHCVPGTRDVIRALPIPEDL